MNIELYPKVVFRKNLYLILFLLCAHILGVISRYYFHHGSVYGLVPLFDLDTEANIPTFYSSAALLFSCILLLFISITHKKQGESYIHWLGLSFIFLFLSFDEITEVHERLVIPVREYFHTSGLLFQAWVIPYGIALCVLIIAYTRFLFNLPRNTMFLFLISGSTFISGAIGFEILGGVQIEANGGSCDLLCTLFYTCEESLEMLGIAIFIYALLTYIADQFESTSITLSKTCSNQPLRI